ncbi:M23 family metallopeptidase [Nocardia sp. NBC_00403]|uniref:M23 family metallopeptidase n=1 Tax=Nocardia sp. NBC_00403 TaxID=2975990 RepID=UPI002E1D1901
MTRYWPLPRGRIATSRFGSRGVDFRWGVDLGRPGGSGGAAVYAVQAGTVVFAGPASGFGGLDPAGWVVVDHPTEIGGGATVCGHVIREVAIGERVEAGQRIARINPDYTSRRRRPVLALRVASALLGTPRIGPARPVAAAGRSRGPTVRYQWRFPHVDGS